MKLLCRKHCEGMLIIDISIKEKHLLLIADNKNGNRGQLAKDRYNRQELTCIFPICAIKIQENNNRECVKNSIATKEPCDGTIRSASWSLPGSCTSCRAFAHNVSPSRWHVAHFAVTEVRSAALTS